MSEQWSNKEFVTPKELSEVVGVTDRTIRRRISAGKIKAEKILGPVGWEYQIPVEEAQRVVMSEKEAGQDPTDIPDDHGDVRSSPWRESESEASEGENIHKRQMSALVQYAQTREELARAQGELRAVVDERDYLRERVEYLEKALANQQENWITAWRELKAAEQAAAAEQETATAEKRRSFWAKLFGKSK